MNLSKTSSLKSIIIFVTKILLVKSYSSGPPTSVCNSMKPGHGITPQNSPIPFQLVPEEQIIEAGETVNLVLKSTSSENFRGFLVRAFEYGTDNSYGSFEFNSST